MYQREKINRAARITDHSMSVVHLYVKGNEQFQNFRDAEENDTTDAFFKNELGLSKDLGERLATFYKIVAEITELQVDVQAHIFSANLSDLSEYMNVQTISILVEQQWLKDEFKYYPNRSSAIILELTAKKVSFLEENLDLILSVDPNGEIEKMYGPKSENKEAFLQKSLADNSIFYISKIVFREFFPDNHLSPIKIEERYKKSITQTLKESAASRLFHLSGLSEYEINEISGNPNKQLIWFSQQNSIEYVALIALTLATIPYNNRYNPEFLISVANLVLQYEKGVNFLNESDYKAMVRLCEYVFSNFEALEKRHKGLLNDETVNFTLRILHTHAASYYTYFRENKTAEKHYIKAINYATKSSDKEDLNYTVMKFVFYYEEHKSPIEYLYFLQEVLNVDRTKFGLPKGKILTTESTKIVNISIANLLLENKFTQKEKALFKGESDFYTGIKQIIDNDDMSQENMSQMLRILSDTTRSLEEDTLSPEDKFRRLLNDTENFVGENNLENSENRLSELSKLYENIVINHEEQKRLDLLVANNEYLQTKTSSIDKYRKTLAKIEVTEYFTHNHLATWYCQYILSYSLKNVLSEEDEKELEITVLKTINLFSDSYFVDFKQAKIWIKTNQSIENLIKALTANVEKTFDPKKKQFCLYLLFNVITFQQQFANYFRVSNNQSVYDTKIKKTLIKQLKDTLSEYYSDTYRDTEKLKDLVNQIRDLDYPRYRGKELFRKLNKPEQRSILYYYFFSESDSHPLLTIHFDPSNTRFAYKYEIIYDSESIEIILNETVNEFDFAADNDLFTHIFDQPLIPVRLSEILCKFFTESFQQRLSNLFSVDEEKEEEEVIQLYCDKLLHLVPFETLPLSRKDDRLTGEVFSFSNILLRESSNYGVRLDRGINVFSGVPAGIFGDALPYSDIEANKIKEIGDKEGFKVNIYQKDQANLTNFLNLVQNRSGNIFHFAVHGEGSSDLPAECSALVLSSDATGHSSKLLTFEEIIHLDLSFVELIVLSACNSSVGATIKGTPMQGLAYAFLAAGAKNVLASRRKIHDKTAPVFIHQFYKELSEGYSCAESLKRTRIYFKDNKILTIKDLSGWGLWT